MIISFRYDEMSLIPVFISVEHNLMLSNNQVKMEKFSLKWNDYQSNVSKSFQSLRDKEDFCDVTLVGDDYKQVTAHKVILSSCSEYFNNILKNNGKQAHLVLCLEGIRYQDLQNILDYVYTGELRIYQEDLDRFLAVAQRLRLEGLIGQENTMDENAFEETKTDINLEVAVPQKIVKRTDPTQDRNMISLAAGDYDTMEKLDQKVAESYSRRTDGMFSCHYCPREFKNGGHIKEHVEVHFDGLVLNCNFCDKTFRSRLSLRHHLRKHKINPFISETVTV